MAKFYFFIILLFNFSLSHADTNLDMERLINNMQCVGCNFSNLELKKLNLWNYNISKSNFSNSNLIKSNFQGSNLSESNLMEVF